MNHPVFLAIPVAFAAVCCATGGPVLRTVTDDPALPSAVINGVKLHVLTYGDPANPPLIVVHGGPGNDARYLMPLRALSDQYYVVFYDQRGSGLSERVGDEALTLEALYRELGEVIARYGRGQPVRLLGHSWGGMLASGFVGRHPEVVSHLVLAEPGMLTPETAKVVMEATNGMRPKMSLEVLWLGTKAWFASLGIDGPDPDARDDWMMGTLAGADFDGHPTAGYYCGRSLANARIEGWRFGARVAPALFEKAFDEDGRLTIDFITGVDRFPHKVLFVAGSCNTVLGPELQRRHMRHFRDPELVVIEGAGHTMFGEKPEESIGAVRQYLAEPHPRVEPAALSADSR